MTAVTELEDARAAATAANRRGTIAGALGVVLVLVLVGVGFLMLHRRHADDAQAQEQAKTRCAAIMAGSATHADGSATRAGQTWTVTGRVTSGSYKGVTYRCAFDEDAKGVLHPTTEVYTSNPG